MLLNEVLKPTAQDRALEDRLAAVGSFSQVKAPGSQEAPEAKHSLSWM
jgi:hypothetical protein